MLDNIASQLPALEYLSIFIDKNETTLQNFPPKLKYLSICDCVSDENADNPVKNISTLIVPLSVTHLYATDIETIILHDKLIYLVLCLVDNRKHKINYLPKSLEFLSINEVFDYEINHLTNLKILEISS